MSSSPFVRRDLRQFQLDTSSDEEAGGAAGHGDNVPSPFPTDASPYKRTAPVNVSSRKTPAYVDPMLLCSSSDDEAPRAAEAHAAQGENEVATAPSVARQLSLSPHDAELHGSNAYPLLKAHPPELEGSARVRSSAEPAMPSDGNATVGVVSPMDTMTHGREDASSFNNNNSNTIIPAQHTTTEIRPPSRTAPAAHKLTDHTVQHTNASGNGAFLEHIGAQARPLERGRRQPVSVRLRGPARANSAPLGGPPAVESVPPRRRQAYRPRAASPSNVKPAGRSSAKPPSSATHDATNARPHSSPQSGPQSGRRSLYDMARVQRRRHEAWVAEQQELRDRRDTKECTFEPSLCVNSRRIVETRVNGIVVQLSPPRHVHVPPLPSRREMEEEATLRECTFTPAINQASRAIVRNNVALAAHAAVPVSSRLHDDFIRRERTLYALARVSLYSGAPNRAVVLSEREVQSVVERVTSTAANAPRIKDSRALSSGPKPLAERHLSRDAMRVSIDRLSQPPTSLPEEERRARQGLSDRPMVGVVSTLVRSLAAKECLRSWFTFIFQPSCADDGPQERCGRDRISAECETNPPSPASSHSDASSPALHEAEAMVREHIVSALLSPADWSANSAEDFSTARRVIGVLLGTQRITPSALASLPSFTFQRFARCLSQYEKMCGPQPFSRSRPTVDSLVMTCPPPPPKPRLHRSVSTLLNGGAMSPSRLATGRSSWSTSRTRSSSGPLPATDLVRRSHRSASVAMGRRDGTAAVDPPHVTPPVSTAFDADVTRRACEEMEALLFATPSARGSPPLTASLPRQTVPSAACVSPDRRAHLHGISAVDVYLSPLTAADSSPNDGTGNLGGRAAHTLGSKGVVALGEVERHQFAPTNYLPTQQSISLSLSNGHASTTPLGMVHHDPIVSYAAATGALCPPELHPPTSCPSAPNAAASSRGSEMPICSKQTAKNEGGGHASLLLVCAQMNRRRHGRGHAPDTATLRDFGTRFAQQQLTQ